MPGMIYQSEVYIHFFSIDPGAFILSSSSVRDPRGGAGSLIVFPMTATIAVTGMRRAHGGRRTSAGGFVRHPAPRRVDIRVGVTLSIDVGAAP